MNQSSLRSIPPSILAALAGAVGGLLSFPVGEVVGSLADFNAPSQNFTSLLLGSACWSAAIGLVIGAAILIWDNWQSLRGQWHRDVLGGLPLFFALSFVGGAAGELAFSLIQNSITRGIGWALMGAGVGAGIGILRRDWLQSGRGALGGLIGGFIGGFIFDALTLVSSAGSGSLSRAVGQIVMGALIAALMRVVQDALKDAWLLGISTGPYEGKEYPLNTARVTVGRAQTNDISLFREESALPQIGALVFQNGQWFWQGEVVSINGVPQMNTPLAPGDTLQLGATKFRFQTRSVKNPTPFTPPVSPSQPVAYAPTPPTSPTVADWPQTPTPPTIVAPQWALMTLSGQLFRLPNEPFVTIGRTSQNQIVLNDAGVSSNHARLQLAPGALSICDLGSTNGTFVNGQKLAPNAPHPLQIGDRVRFGALETTVRSA